MRNDDETRRWDKNDKRGKKIVKKLLPECKLN